jgi:hypothetical protein
MPKISVQPHTFSLLANATNALADRRDRDYQRRQSQEFTELMESRREEFATRYRQEGWDKEDADAQAEIDAYNEAAEAYTGVMGSTETGAPVAGTPDTLPTPYAPIVPPELTYDLSDVSRPWTVNPVMPQPSPAPSPSVAQQPPPPSPILPVTTPVRDSGATGALPSPPMVDPPPPAPGETGYVPYDTNFLLPPADLSGRALQLYYERTMPFHDTAISRKFTGADQDEAAELAATEHFFDFFPTWRTMTDEQKAEHFAQMNDTVPEGVDRSIYLDTLGRLFNYTTVGHETPRETQLRTDAERLMDVIGPIDTVWALKHEYRMEPEQIAEYTGKPIEEVNEILSTRPRSYDPRPTGTGSRTTNRNLSIPFANLSPEQIALAATINPNMEWSADYSEVLYNQGITNATGQGWIEDFWTDIYKIARNQEINEAQYTDAQLEVMDQEAIKIFMRMQEEAGGTDTGDTTDTTEGE